jgi:hypothetical protein
MSALQDIRERAALLLRRTEDESALPTSALESLGPATENEQFSLFEPEHMKRAQALARRFMEIANANPGPAGLQEVLDAAEEAAQTEDIDLVKYALMVFIAHHPEGRSLPIPPLESRSPQKVLPSQRDSATGLEALGALGEEAQLDWFREDPTANDHHIWWHVVYPWDGRSDENDPDKVVKKDRQGELFVYMHQQMLARYDTERVALGLLPTDPLDDYRSPIAEGYDANLPRYSNRGPDRVMADLAGYTISDHEERRDRLFKAAKDGKLKKGNTEVEIDDVNILGATIEANIESVGDPEDPLSHYGMLHNVGHGIIAALRDPLNDPRRGVMSNPEVAIRDPVFFRWHRHVDDIAFAWQQEQQPHDLSDAPKVKIRKSLDGSTSPGTSPDIILCLQEAIPEAAAPGFDGQAFGEAAFGGANWDTDFSSGGHATAELRTRMLKRTLDDTGVEIEYVNHSEFYYFIRIENALAQPQEVTVRVFLVASDYADDRRMWIEMDKFQHSLKASERAVIFRPARLSSVVRKPARRPTEPEPEPEADPADQFYCNCGWPYHMLLPRGTQTGMDFRLLVMITDWRIDRVDSKEKCGSLSFCGKRDAKYPDIRPMGYPFDRPSPQGGSITQTIAAQENMAARDIKIRLE